LLAGTTHVVTIPFQHASGTSAGTPTKLLVSTPHKVATTVSGTASPGSDHLILPRNAKIITSSPGLRQATLIKTEHKTVTSTPLTIDGNKVQQIISQIIQSKYYYCSPFTFLVNFPIYRRKTCSWRVTETLYFPNTRPLKKTQGP
jgi:hypothetical protein